MYSCWYTVFYVFPDAVKVCGGEDPPPWLYVETAKPLVQSLGKDGYQQMVILHC